MRERKKITKINTVLIGRKKEDGKRLEREIKWESERREREREREQEEKKDEKACSCQTWKQGMDNLSTC